MRRSSSCRTRGFRVIPFAMAVVLLCSAAFGIENKLNVPIMQLKDVKTGMKGEALTVFSGTKPEKMEVEVLGVLRNMSGPKGDVILVRLHGDKPEYTGVVAGMSGSPVYIDGKLVGAIAYRIGEMSKEPIAGVTPIESMLEISEYDKTPGADVQLANAKPSGPTQTSGPGVSPQIPGVQSMVSYLKPIDTPLVFNGYSEEALRQFAPQFAQAGIMPVMGAGSSSSDVKQPEPITAGSSVGAVLVRGDMDIAATCTVTYADADHLLACGHPFLNFGEVEMPMTKSQVLATLPSPLNAFKIANTTETVGSFVQDRKSGILGRFGREPHMIPVTLNVTSQGRTRTLHFEVLNNARMTPVAMMASVYNAVQGTNAYGEDITFHIAGSIDVAGFPKITLDNMYAPQDGTAQPAGVQAAMAVGDRFNRIFENPYEKADVKGVNLDVSLLNERRAARLESARTDSVEARPGDTINVETVLRPYRGEAIMKQIAVRIPSSVPRGNLRILISDGDTLDRIGRVGPGFNRKYDLSSTITMLNQEHSNSRVYVSLLENAPQATVGDNVMPALPGSVMNVMEGMRSTQDMTVMGESRISEASSPMDYVVTGQQVLNINIK